MNRVTRRAVRSTARRMARLVVGTMYRIEEHVSDPAERLALLKEALTRVGRGAVTRDLLTASQPPMPAAGAPEPPDPTTDTRTPRWRSWWPW